MLYRPAIAGQTVNDVHSRLNATRVRGIVSCQSVKDIERAVVGARRLGNRVCVAGGRHAMGAQQFGSDCLLIDTTEHKRVLNFDADKGTVEVEAGIRWAELIAQLLKRQVRKDRQWGINQKQSGADSLSLGGAVSANIHGRGLNLPPFVGDIESLAVVGQDGISRRCSRHENSELFSLVIGGYGLFGIVAAVTLRLSPRQKLRRQVAILDGHDLMSAFQASIADGALYGDFQFAIDNDSQDFLRRGILSTYCPVAADTPMPEDKKALSPADWRRLVWLAHHDKKKAFKEYSQHYLASAGQLYWSDTHQLSTYLDDYHLYLDRQSSVSTSASEIITELYVPRPALPAFLECVREDFLENAVDLIYGTVRLIEKDSESFLAWAGKPFACVIFNLHTAHTAAALSACAQTFRRLIDLAIGFGGSYYLTYHKFATAEQLLACYPQFPAFLRLKDKYDQTRLFDSNWYRHYSQLLAS